MNGFFNVDNPVMRFLTKLFDVMYLSILWVVFSMPIITIGASTTAMYYTSVKVIRRDCGYVFQEFFKSFKMNFVQATVSWVVVAGGSILFYSNMRFAYGIKGDMGTLLTVIYAFMGVFIIGCGAYVFPVLSRFTMKIGQLFKTSIFLFFKHFPRSVLLIVILAAGFSAMYLLRFSMFVVPACTSLVFSLVMEPVLKMHTPHEENEEGGEPRRDEWYLE